MSLGLVVTARVSVVVASFTVIPQWIKYDIITEGLRLKPPVQCTKTDPSCRPTFMNFIVSAIFVARESSGSRRRRCKYCMTSGNMQLHSDAQFTTCVMPLRRMSSTFSESFFVPSHNSDMIFHIAVHPKCFWEKLNRCCQPVKEKLAWCSVSILNLRRGGPDVALDIWVYERQIAKFLLRIPLVNPDAEAASGPPL